MARHSAEWPLGRDTYLARHHRPWLRALLPLVTLATLQGCAGDGADTATRELVRDPVAAIRAALPAGWVVQKVEDDAHPFYLEKGNGKAIYIGPPLEAIDPSKVKTPHQAVLWIMPPDYQGRPVAGASEVQTITPWRLAATKDAVLYWWGSPPEEVKAAILDAIFAE